MGGSAIGPQVVPARHIMPLLIRDLILSGRSIAGHLSSTRAGASALASSSTAYASATCGDGDHIRPGLFFSRSFALVAGICHASHLLLPYAGVIISSHVLRRNGDQLVKGAWLCPNKLMPKRSRGDSVEESCNSHPVVDANGSVLHFDPACQMFARCLALLLNAHLEVIDGKGSFVGALEVRGERLLHVEPVVDGELRKTIVLGTSCIGKHKWQVADGGVITAACNIHGLVIVLEPSIRFGNSVVTFDVSGELESYRNIFPPNSRTKAFWAMIVILAGELDPI